MRRLSPSLFALLLLAVDLAPGRTEELAAQESPQAPRITLANGDYVIGKLADSDQADQLCWQGDGLTEKLVFPISAVSSAHFPLPEATNDGGGGDFSFELVGGDALTGSFESLSDAYVEMKSERLGTLRIDRDQVRRIVRFNHKGETIFSGPNGLSGWSSPKRDNPWKDEGGQLAATAPGEIAFADLKIPDKASVDIEASWQEKASFSIHFGAAWQALPQVLDGFGNILGKNVQVDRTQADKPSSLFSLETWGDWIVIVRETKRRADVAPLVRLSPGPGRIHLRLLFDQTTGRVAVYSADGELLGEATAIEDEKHSHGGLLLENKAGDLRVEYLAVHSWFGDKPTAVDAERSHLQTSQGGVFYSDSLTYEAGAKEFVVTASEQDSPAEPPATAGTSAAENESQPAVPLPATRVPLADVTILSFQPSAALPQQPMRVALYDGSRISGELVGVANGRLLIRRPGIDAPLELPIDHLRMIASPTAKTPQLAAIGRAGCLESSGLRLHGWLADFKPGESAHPAGGCLHWQALTSVTSSALAEDFSGSIVYREPPQPAKKNSAKLARPRAAVQPLQARAAARAKPGGVAAVLPAAGGGDATNNKPVLMNDGSNRGTQLLWLRAGDCLPCTIEMIDDHGVTFKSTTVAATFLPHDAVKAWERQGGRSPQDLDPEKRERLLTLPRMQRGNPPTHLVESTSGDFLRGQLQELNAKTLQISVRLESKKLAVADVASIVWFEPLPSTIREGDEAATVAAAPDAITPPVAIIHGGDIQAVRSDGVRLTFRPEEVADGVIDGESKLLGKCRVDVREVDQLLLGQAIAKVTEGLAYHQWRLKPATDPQFVSEGAGPGGKGDLADKPAPNFHLSLVDGRDFTLSQERGKVVVLDFWASWCGPCMQSMPKLATLAQEFDSKAVRFVGVNMQEDRDTVVGALERLNVKLEIALDVDGATGEKFSVSAIPHTVVIDRRGNVAAVLIGGGPDMERQLREALTKLLDGATPTTP